MATWVWTGLILFLAIAGKMGGAIFGARITGQPWRFSLGLAALLNTRGLVELIVLNIAYNAHVFSPTLYTMLVVMALVTTAMTVPILNLLGFETIPRYAQFDAGELNSTPRLANSGAISNSDRTYAQKVSSSGAPEPGNR